jgi:hypothetical protein
MKKLLSISMMLILMMSVVGVVGADSPAPGGPFSTAFYVQNLGGATANCTFQFFNATGGVSFTSGTNTVNAGSALYVYTPLLSGLATGTYSGVVSCDQPVAAIVNFSDTNSGASHAGVTTPGLTWFAPAVYDNYYNYYATIIAQNATSAPVDITVEIYSAAQVAPIHTITQPAVPANASASFEMEGLTQLGDNVVYSAKVIGTGNIAPIVTIYGRAGASEQLYSYNPFTGGSTTVYTPVIMNNFYGYNTSLSVQNIGAASTAITVTYGTGQQQTANLSPNQSIEFYTPAVPGMGTGDPAGLTGATIVSSGQNIVALVNESNSVNRAASYSGFAAGSTSVFTPSLFRRYYEYNSSITCQNVGSAAATMTLTYAPPAEGSPATGTTTSPSVNPGQTTLFYQPIDTNITDFFSAAGTITSAQPIVCVVNEDQNENPGVFDLLYAYNGIAP